MSITSKDEQLIALLRGDGRMSVTELARQLGVSRTAAQARLDKLERNGVITGYTVRLSENYVGERVRALVLVKAASLDRRSLENLLNRVRGLTALYSVSGEYDMAAVVSAPTVEALDSELDRVGTLPGVSAILPSVILSTRLER